MNYVIYGKPNCQFCVRAMAILQSKNLEFTYKTLDVDFNREELLTKFPEARTFPQIETADGTYIGGYTELKEHLG